MTTSHTQTEVTPYDTDEFVEFRRGFDNSHDNRMMTGSYSRYLMTTGLLSEHMFMETFYGSMPALGMALNSVERAQQLEQHHQQQRTRHYSPQRRLCQSRNKTHFPPNAHKPEQNQTTTNYGYSTNKDNNNTNEMTLASNDRPHNVHTNNNNNINTFTGTMNSTLPREMDLLPSGTLHSLNIDRTNRRVNRKLVNRESDLQQVDFVYYNYNSKGCFIPREPVNKNALLLHYDDLYDFGDGTRFAAVNESHEHEYQATRNPHAGPPKTFAQTQYLLHRHRYHKDTHQERQQQQQEEQYENNQHNLFNRQQKQMEQPLHAQSLRTATSIDPNKLHCSQFRSVKSIEDVLASSAITPEEYAKREITVQHIKRAVNDGKIGINELAPSMKAMLETTKEAEHYDANCNSADASEIVQDANNEGAIRHEVSRLRYTKPFTRTTTPSVYVH